MQKIIEYSRDERHGLCLCAMSIPLFDKRKIKHITTYRIVDKNEKREIYYQLERCSTCKKVRFSKTRRGPYVPPKKIIFIHSSNHRNYWGDLRNKWNSKISKKDKKFFCRYFPELKEILVH